MIKEEDFKSLVKLVMELGELALSLNRRVAKLEGKELPGTYIITKDGRKINVDDIPGGIASIRHIILRKHEKS